MRTSSHSRQKRCWQSHAEQQLIVAKADELIPLCDRLEASLTDTDDTRHRLLDALLHEALSESSAMTPEEAA